MKRVKILQGASNLKELAIILGFKPKALSYILYKKPAALKYTRFQIAKRSGGMRDIDAPSSDLKSLQRRVSNILQDCISDINEERNVSSTISHGFRRKCSIISNAVCHKNKRYVFNIDLADFFGTINFGRVRGFFIKNNNFNLEPAVATVLAQVACHNNALPQGSPCSPVISNLVAHVLDIRLAALAKECGCDYSRYADDLTFSTNKTAFPKGIAQKLPGHTHEWKAGSDLTKIITRSGFTINPTKTRMQYRQSRQDVTGLVVNKKVNVREEYAKLARSMAHNLFSTGQFYRTVHTIVPPATAPSPTEVPGTLNQLQGIFSFIDHVKRSSWNEGNPRPDKLVGYERLYRKYLFYKEFYANSRPIILFEGKTDNIYIRSAIKSLFKKYPKLAKKKKGKVELQVQFMSYTKTTARILSLSGGTGELNKLLYCYKKEWKQFSAGHKKQPVIVFIDNDQGSSEILKAAKNISKKNITRKEPFVYLGDNLYLVMTPLTSAGKDTMIEDFFRASVRAEKLNGKKFNPGKSFDDKTEYGKYLFAEKIIRPKIATIDFARFKPLLDRIVEVLDDYAAKP